MKTTTTSNVRTSNRKNVPERGYTLPLVLTCHVTGKQVKYTLPSYIDKVIEKYGSLEKLRKNFVSQEGRRGTTKVTETASSAVEYAQTRIDKIVERAMKKVRAVAGGNSQRSDSDRVAA